MPKGRPKGSPNKPKAKPKEQYDAETIAWAKAETLRFFDKGEIDDLSEAAEKVGVSKLTLYAWRKADKKWREALNQAEQPIADKLLKEILADTMPNGKPISMPYVTARIMCSRVVVLLPTISDAANTAVHISDTGTTYYPLYKFDADAAEDFIVNTASDTTTKAIVFDIGGAQFIKIYTDVAQDPTISFQVQGIQD